MIYCADTSALIDLWRQYPIDVFYTLWDNVDEMIETGRLKAPEHVLRELERGDDDLFRWLKERDSMFVPLLSEVQQETFSILRDFPRLVTAHATETDADPLVIAVARLWQRVPSLQPDPLRGQHI